MPDLEKLLKGVQQALASLLGPQTAEHIKPWIAGLLLAAAVMGALCALLVTLAKMKRALLDDLLPRRFMPEARRRARRRRRFAEHVYDSIARLDSDQQWNDYHFAELEAHVEMEGRRRALFNLPSFLSRERSGLRMEPSLTKAIDISRERLILVEGDPGAGKSVALRHVATTLARRAKERANLTRAIPVFLNLKELKREAEQSIDRNLIEAFVLESLNRTNDRDVAQFLEEEWRLGLESGTWMFLFDSFDEMADVLSATESDTTIRAYTLAIGDFLSGLNSCRGVVASRYFRGPGQVPWPRFRILPLTEQRRAALVEKADLPTKLETEVLGRLPMAAVQLGPLVNNPMFLGLLCEHVRAGNPFPDNVHAVFEGYVAHRFGRDAERVRKRFDVTIDSMRMVAEHVAFAMASEDGLGISPTRARVLAVLERAGIRGRVNVSACLDALEFIKLARTEAAGQGALFTFAHRRFQEYFATCVVLRSPDRVSARDLVLDGRWRETATVTCQTAEAATLVPILNECRYFLERIAATEDPTLDPQPDAAPLREFDWPAGLLHVLNLLQDGFRGRLEDLPLDLRARIGHVLTRLMQRATLSHRKWALEVCGAAPDEVFLDALRRAFASDSQWLTEVAYRQVARLPLVPDDVGRSIRHALLTLALQRRLWSERHATHAHLSRVKPSQPFLRSLRLLLVLPFIDVCGMFAASALILTYLDRFSWALAPVVVPVVVFARWVERHALASMTSPTPRKQRVQQPRTHGWITRIPGLARFKKRPKTSDNVVRLYSSAMSLLMPLYIRAVFFVVPVWSPVEIWKCLLAWSLAAWGPFAYVAAVTGTFTTLSWWPLLSVWPLLYLLANSVAISRKLRVHWRRALASVVWIAVWAWVWPRYMLVVDSGYLRTPTLVFLVVASGVFVLGGILWLFELIADYRVWRLWSGSACVLDAAGFLSYLGRFRQDRGRLKFLISVRAQCALDQSAITTLVALTSALEDGAAVSEDFVRWRAQYEATRARRITGWGANVLDELCRLREALQLEELRSSSAPSSQYVASA